VVLGASLVSWAHTQSTATNALAWVGRESSNAPAVETAEIWQTSADCVRPFFVKAVLRSKARLKAYYDVAPDELRAWRNRQERRESLHPSPDQKGPYRYVSAEPDAGLEVAQSEYDATLHAQYAEWFATVSKLTIQESQWEQRLTTVADQKVIIGDATRRGFAAYSGQELELANAKGGFEHYILFLLGLGGFAADEEAAIEHTCVVVTPIKKIVQSVSYWREVWRWPIDRAVAFSLGLELILGGLFFIPIALWIRTGDPRVVARHFGTMARQVAASVSTLRRRHIVRGIVSKVRTIPLRAIGNDSVSAFRIMLARMRAWLEGWRRSDTPETFEPAERPRNLGRRRRSPRHRPGRVGPAAMQSSRL
jgi:hypothetical protein